MLTLTKFEQSAFLLHSSKTDQSFAFDFGSFSKEQVAKLPPVKGLFISHVHGDHFSMENIKMINAERVFGSVEVQIELENAGTHCGKLINHDRVGCGAIELEVFEVNHGPISRPISNLGFHITLEDKHILFCGDVKVDGEVPQVEYDVVLIPVCGGPVIFDATEALVFINQLPKPKLIIPIHYEGTADPQSGNVFAQAAGSEYKVKVLGITEKIELP